MGSRTWQLSPGGIIPIIHKTLLAVQGHPVPADGKAQVVAPPGGDIVVGAGVLYIAGVVQIQGSVFHQGGAGVGAVAVKGLVRIQHDRQRLPVDQVGAADMTPMLDPAGSIEGAVLIKDVVSAIVTAQAVGVVQPAYRGLDVVVLPVAVGGDGVSAQLFRQGDQAFQVSLQRIHVSVRPPVSR